MSLVKGMPFLFCIIKTISPKNSGFLRKSNFQKMVDKTKNVNYYKNMEKYGKGVQPKMRLRLGIIKPIIGILLILLAIGSLTYWETVGRETVTTKEVVTACTDISSGSTITPEMLKISRVLHENIVDGAFSSASLLQLEGEVAGRDIKANTQITADCLKLEKTFPEGKSPFKIEKDWISSVSSSLRRGDTICFYKEDGTAIPGEYQVAFVKNSEDGEIAEADGSIEPDMWERLNATGKIDHIEIVATLEEYISISAIVSEPGIKLLIVQKGD